MSRKTPRSRRLMVEGLESRAMLAGNVTVAVTDGILRISGDNASNAIDIQQLSQTFEGEWPGSKLEIKGTLSSDGLPTTINGEASVIVEGVKRGAAIYLQHGNNKLQIGNTSNPRPSGTPPVNLSGHVQIGSWSGNDKIHLSITNGARVTVNSGPGNDYIYVTQSKLNNVTVNSDHIPAEGQIAVGGDDDVILRTNRLRGTVAIAMGTGDDMFRASVKSVFDGSLSVDVGSGMNRMELGDVTFNGQCSILGGVDTDSLSLSARIHGDVFADLGDGNDRCHISGISTTVVRVDLGRGNDSAILLSESLVGITLDGGIDEDTLRQLSTNPEGEETFLNFETIEGP